MSPSAVETTPTMPIPKFVMDASTGPGLHCRVEGQLNMQIGHMNNYTFH
jgi:hypothetical protein